MVINHGYKSCSKMTKKTEGGVVYIRSDITVFVRRFVSIDAVLTTFELHFFFKSTLCSL